MAYENSVYEYNENGELCVRVTGAGGSGGGDVSSVNGKTGAVVLNASDVGAIPQVSELPTASESNLGNIVQYVGATTENYTNGYFYKCVASDSGVDSGEIDVNYWYPDQFTPPVTGSVDIDVFSAYLEQNNLDPISDGKIEIWFQPNNNNINFGYNIDTGAVYIDIPWNTVTTQSAEDILANMGFDFDLSGVPTNVETATGGQMPSATVYFWKEQPVMNSIGVYKDYSELPEATEENVGTAYLVTPYDSGTLTPYSPEMYMSVPYILNFIDGEAEVTGYGLTPETQPTNVMIDWATLESYLNSQETGFDLTNDTINISLNGKNFLEVMYNVDFSASAGVQTDGTIANIQQALENMGITVDLTGYTQFQFLFLKLPTEKGYENRQVPAFVPTSGTEETGYVLKTYGGGGTYWAAEAGGLPDQYQQDGKFLMTDGSNASWESALRNISTGNNSLTIEGTPTSEATGTNVGKLSRAEGAGTTAYGWYAEARAEGATAVGSGATVKDLGGIALGRGAETRDGGFVIALWDSQKHTYKMCDLSGYIPSDRLKNAINKYSVMPTASVDNHGWIVQFTGTTDSTYTHGHLYECVTDGIEPITYSWTEVSMGGGSGLPDQTGQSGKFLTTDGTAASWSDKPLVNTATGNYSMCVGQTGSSASGTYSLAVGSLANSAQRSVAIGSGARTTANYTTAIGDQAGCYGGQGSVAIGSVARANAANAIQIAATNNVSVNSDANTMKVANANGNFEMMDANGNLPADRLASTTGLADGNYRLRLTMTNGVPTLSWVAE